jgi:aminoglycoside/choline kinase family phosphotransferase
MTDWINRSDFRKKITIFPENSMLGTGGGLKKAESFLCDKTFLVHNSDILSDIDLAGLVEFHISSGNLATLAVHDCLQYNNVIVDEKGLFKGIKRQGISSDKPGLVAFTGIAVYEPEFQECIPGGQSHIVDAWIHAQSAGRRVGTLDVSGCSWNDIGTIPSYASAVFRALKADGEMVFIDPSVEGCSDIQMDGYIVVEGRSVLRKGAFLRNCILLPESTIESSVNYENCILGSEFQVKLREFEILGLSAEHDTLPIGTGGSDRAYYRKRDGNKTSVVLRCSNEDPDFQRQITYTRFFLKQAVPVPELREVQHNKKRATFEDLGDLSLYSWLKCERQKEQIEEMYRRALDGLISIHTTATWNVAVCPPLQSRVFDYEHFRWETDYFEDRFVHGVAKREVKNPSALKEEFHRLALKADSFPKTIVHRDFQSQNIVIDRGETPRFIDYQGARMGPPGYDVASILWDPYYRLDSDIREQLLNYYAHTIEQADLHGRKRKGEKDAEKRSFIRDTFMDTLLSCRLQRHMQALGAYGFLSAVKGKKYFLKYVPEGLRLLKEDLSLAKEEFPVLYELVKGL